MILFFGKLLRVSKVPIFRSTDIFVLIYPKNGMLSILYPLHRTDALLPYNTLEVLNSWNKRTEEI